MGEYTEDDEAGVEVGRWVVRLNTRGEQQDVAIKPKNLVEISRESYDRAPAHQRTVGEQAGTTPGADAVDEEDDDAPLSVAQKAARAMVTLEQFMGIEGPQCNYDECAHGSFMTRVEVILPIGNCGVQLNHTMYQAMEDGENEHTKYLPKKVDGLYEMIDLEGAWGRWSAHGAAVSMVNDASVGLETGDIIFSIDGTRVLDEPAANIINMLSSDPSHEHTVVVLRINHEAISAHVERFDLHYVGPKVGERRRRLVHEDTHAALTSYLGEF